MASPQILNLRVAGDRAADDDDSGPAATGSIAAQITQGLQKQDVVIPGSTEADRQYKYAKTLPTMILYDDKGLDIYDEITKLEEYYLYSSELAILQKHGKDIARRLFSTSSFKSLSASSASHSDRDSEEPELTSDSASTTTLDEAVSTVAESVHKEIPLNDEELGKEDGYGDRAERMKYKERWGDASVGKNNYGVNGSLGLDSSFAASSSSASAATAYGSVVELGAGSLKKTGILLRNLSEVQREGAEDDESTRYAQLERIDYFALDLEYGQLDSTLKQLAEKENDSITLGRNTSNGADASHKIHARGICASYDEALPALKSGKVDKVMSDDTSVANINKRQCILFLGSSIGNYSRDEAVDFLRKLADEAMAVGDTLLIGVDSCDDKTLIETAYNDPKGVTGDFILNGIDHANRILGGNAGLRKEDFEYVARYNKGEGRHEAYLKATKDVDVKHEGEAVSVKQGELIAIERSYKYTVDEANALFAASGLRIVRKWTDTEETGVYNLFLLEKPQFAFSSTLDAIKKGENPFGVPTLQDWDLLWSAWDCVTLDMIPRDLLHSKPIDLRHICLFYLGHIPGFLDIHLSRYFKAPFTEPAHFPEMFERGIDPNMDDPSKVHAHSVVPSRMEDWPSVDEIIAYRDSVRARLQGVYLDHINVESAKFDRRLARVLAMVYEHEAMHLETLLYMCAQIAPGKLQCPPGFAAPDWAYLSEQWNAEVAAEQRDTRSQVIKFEASDIDVGHDDFDHQDAQTAYDAGYEFGWDNESPKRKVHVDSFHVSLLPISNADYLKFFEESGCPDKLLPGSWVRRSGDENGYGVKVLISPNVVSLEHAKYWPCMASGCQLQAYAQHVGGRLPSECELRRYMLDHPVDQAGSNIGFANWHPVPARLPKTLRGGSRIGASNGGVWEWTATEFAQHEGWRAAELYPGYSRDFFDGCHWVMLGGSLATIPRIAGRSSFTNWYQANYPYVFAGARVAYDA